MTTTMILFFQQGQCNNDFTAAFTPAISFTMEVMDDMFMTTMEKTTITKMRMRLYVIISQQQNFHYHKLTVELILGNPFDDDADDDQWIDT